MENEQQKTQQPNQNQVPNSPPTAAQGAQQPLEDYVFYNVMPKTKTQGGIVEPSMKIEESGEIPAGESRFAVAFKKYKFYFILALVVIVGGPAIYLIFTKFFSQPVAEDNFLIQQAGNKTPPEDAIDDQQGFSTSAEWRTQYFSDCSDVTLCGDEADADHDGLTNLQEYNLNTDPNNPDSDQDGLADGDENNVFESNPLSDRTAGNSDYKDNDYVRGGYDFKTDKLLTAEQLQSLSEKMQQTGLHQPTISSLGDILINLYHFDSITASSTPPAATSTPPTAPTSSPLAGFDLSLEAKQDRDAQRTNTIKNIGVALVQYQEDTGKLPATKDFKAMYDAVKMYLKVATNPQDPVNVEPYVYTYEANAEGTDFTLTFYSEIAGQLIKKHLADAKKDKTLDEANIFDNQRKTDLETIRTSLLIYSNKNIAGEQEYVFPTEDKYKTALVPELISAIPKDPKTGQDYEYKVSETFTSFTLKAVLDNPKPGTTGYLCNQEECREY